MASIGRKKPDEQTREKLNLFYEARPDSQAEIRFEPKKLESMGTMRFVPQMEEVDSMEGYGEKENKFSFYD